jgi:hypothetical protein
MQLSALPDTAAHGTSFGEMQAAVVVSFGFANTLSLAGSTFHKPSLSSVRVAQAYESSVALCQRSYRAVLYSCHILDPHWSAFDTVSFLPLHRCQATVNRSHHEGCFQYSTTARRPYLVALKRNQQPAHAKSCLVE